MLQPRVTDISHHNKVTDLRATANAGVWGIIHKATQGTGYRDPTYTQRRPLAQAAGMLWAAYHFGDSSDPKAQVDNFLTYAKPDNTTLLALDYEDHPQGRSKTMRPQQMVTFLREIEQRTGRKAILYSGNRIKEDIGSLSTGDRAYVASHLLWLCQYGSKPQLPQGFSRSFLWQYTDGRVGPQPHSVPGITGEVDLNAFNGTREQLETAWIASTSTMPATDLSSQSRRGVIDEDDTKPARGTDDDGDTGLPSFLNPAPPVQSNGGINVQPQTAEYSLETEMLQTKMTALGYVGIGIVDGKWGGKTRGAVIAFMGDRGKAADGLTTDAGFTGPSARDAVFQEISRAVAEKWSRPIAPERANATEKDLAPKVETVRVSLWGRFTAKVAAGFAAVGLTGSTISNAFQSVQDTFYPVRNFFAHIPPEAWFVIMGIVAGLVWYVTNRAAKAATKDYNTGRLN